MSGTVRAAAAGGGGQGLPHDVRTALVLGASRSGVGAALALARLGLRVTLTDTRGPECLPGVESARRAGVEFRPERSLEESWPSPDLVIKSPGVPGEARPVALARQRGVPVWSELELAYALFPNPFDAVTGTNGKTTTTALLGHLFAVAGRPVRVLGNIGVAVTSIAGDMAGDEELVVEVSSFQLEDVHAFRPAAAVFLNLTPDHLDRHGTMDRYLACKAKLFANQRSGDVAVLNLADPAVAALGSELMSKPDGPRVAFFSAAGRTQGLPAGSGPPRGVEAISWVDERWMYLESEPVVRLSEIRMPGRHNLENCLAAGTAALARGVDREAVAAGLSGFEGSPTVSKGQDWSPG